MHPAFVHRPRPAGWRPAHAWSMRLAGQCREGRHGRGPGPWVRTKCTCRVLGGVGGTHIRGLGSGEPLRYRDQRSALPRTEHGGFCGVAQASGDVEPRRSALLGSHGWLDVTLVCGAERQWAGSFLSFGFEAGGLRGDGRPEVPGVGSCTCEVGDPSRSLSLEVLGVGHCGESELWGPSGPGSGAGPQGAWERG